jgi:nucleoid-associated protein YgaU
MKRFLTGIGSLVVLIALVVGIPAVLLVVAGNPIPSWDELQSALTGPDFGGRFLLGTLLPLVAWIAWLTFVISLLTVLPSVVRGITPPRIPGLQIQQKTAIALLGAVLIMFTGFSGTASAVASTIDAAPAATSYSASQTSESTASGVAAQVDDAAAGEEADAPTYSVESGDTLWTIAQDKLGDGKRYTEIAQLNYDVVQVDGGALTPSNHWVNPGWTLTLPADAETAAPVAEAINTVAADAAPIETVAAETVTAETASAEAAPEAAPEVTAPSVPLEVTVVPGDTLWDIAEDALGSGDRFPELFEASRGTVQSDGAQLSDPNLILPGWDITVPGIQAPAPAPAPAPEPVTAPEAPQPITPLPSDNSIVATSSDALADSEVDQSIPVISQAGAAEAAAEAAGTPMDAAQGGTGDGPTAAASESSTAPERNITADDATANSAAALIVPLATAGGIGSLLASGLLGLLGLRRFEQGRRRKPGERIAMPSDESVTTERSLRAVEDPTGVAAIDRTLRFVGAWCADTHTALPKLTMVRLADGVVQLRLAAPADLPEPFSATSETNTEWSVLPTALPNTGSAAEAPYLALVTLGHDTNRGHVLVNLEQIGSLGVIGESESTTHGVLTAIAAELASLEWTEGIQVTTVGFGSELADAFDVSHLSAVTDVDALISELTERGEVIQHALVNFHVEDTQPRAAVLAQAAPTEVILVSNIDDADKRQALVDLASGIPRLSIVVAGTAPDEGWTLNVAADRSATLEPVSLALSAQVVGGIEYLNLLESLAITALPALDITVPDFVASVPEFALPFSSPISEIEEDTLDRADVLRAAAPTLLIGAPPAAPMDHTRWLELVGDNITSVPTEQLIAALKLVDAESFAGASHRVIDWSDPFTQELTAAIVDAAHELAERALADSDVATARIAATIGELADPASQIPVRDRLRAENLADNAPGFEQVVARLNQQLADLDDGQPEEETQDLIAELRRYRSSSLAR